MATMTKSVSFVSHLKGLHARWHRSKSFVKPPKEVRSVLAQFSSFNAHAPFAEFTPLHVAIHRRNWSAVNTILTIAAAQQRTKPEPTTVTTAFKTLDINLGRTAPFFLL